MGNKVLWSYIFFGLCAVAVGAWRRMSVQPVPDHFRGNWDQRVAAEYLDSREVWWQKWPAAKRDHGTICISCHTVLPYALARPVLRRELGESAMSAPEKTMTESVEKRVSNWA